MRADRAMGEVAADGRGIDLGTGAPPRSVRRTGAAPPRSARRADDAAPHYSAVLKSGPVRRPGAVPFAWEQRPGQPKSVRTRRGAPPTPPRDANSQARVEEIGGSPYHDALGERDIHALHAVPADGSWARAAWRNEEEEKDKLAAEALRKQEDEDGERFSDALDTLSRSESLAMNCSVSGLSGVPDRASGATAGDETGARGFMMDRFLPAAHAVAAGSPQYTFRKAGTPGRDHARAAAVKASTGNGDDQARRAPVQLPYQHLPPNYLSCAYPRREEHEEEEEEDDDEYDVHSTRGFSSKGCGLLPGLCVKTSLLLMNPVPAMKRGKARGRGRDRQFPSKGGGQMASSPLARSSQNKRIGCDSNGQSWEDVYKHKLEQKYLGQGEDGRSKPATESNHLTFWSDSQTGDGSSPFHNSMAGGTSPYHSCAVMSPSSKANGSFGIGDRDEKVSGSSGSGSLGREHDRSSLAGSDRSSFKGSSSLSSGLDRTGHDDSMDHRGDLDSEASHLGLLLDTKVVSNANTFNSLPDRQQIVGRNSKVKDQDTNSLTEKISEIGESTFSIPSGDTGTVKLGNGNHLMHGGGQEVPQHRENDPVVKKEIMHLQSLLPLPVPRSPSESWLSRTLPSVTNKLPGASFLGIQVQSKKPSPCASIHPENGQKPSRPRQIRFADVVQRPTSLNSEI